MVNVPNQDLVQKGRTFSIDQALEMGIANINIMDSCVGQPRTMSVDSIDYTSMFYGEIEEEAANQLRKERREKKHGKKL